MEAWLNKAIESIEYDAQFAYDMCKQTASEEKVEFDFVIEKFLTSFRKILEDGRKG